MRHRDPIRRGRRGGRARTAAAVGASYLAVARATGGEQISICTRDWSSVFDRLEASVVRSLPLPCTFALPPPHEGMSFDRDRVNVIFTDGGGSSRPLPHVRDAAACGSTGWYYDDPAAPTEIRLCGSSCSIVTADPGGRIDIAFGCASVLL